MQGKLQKAFARRCWVGESYMEERKRVGGEMKRQLARSRCAVMFQFKVGEAG